MKFKNTKMTQVPSKNPFPNSVVASDAAITFSPFVVRKNKGAGPKGQTQRHVFSLRDTKARIGQ